MKIVVGSLAIAAALALAASVAAQPASTPMLTAAPELAFESVPDFLKFPPDLYLGEAAGVAIGPEGHVFVFSRGNTTGPAYGAAAAQLLEFDHDGRYLREIGHNLYSWSYAHAIRFDPQGRLWAADKGSDVVVRFNAQRRVDMVFGRKSEASDEHAHPLEHLKPPAPPVDGLFRQVTDMTWDKAGDIFISDGYINSRVAKYDKNGRWLGTWGEPGAGPGQFNTLHAIVIDHDDHIYVADRGNRRIQVFDTTGKLLRIMTIDVPVPADAPVPIGPRPGGPEFYRGGGKAFEPGSPWAMCITPGPHQVLFVSDAYPGRIYKVGLDGKVLGWFGGSGKQLKEFGWIHELACPSETEVYAAELLNWRVQKLILHPEH